MLLVLFPLFWGRKYYGLWPGGWVGDQGTAPQSTTSSLSTSTSLASLPPAPGLTHPRTQLSDEKVDFFLCFHRYVCTQICGVSLTWESGQWHVNLRSSRWSSCYFPFHTFPIGQWSPGVVTLVSASTWKTTFTLFRQLSYCWALSWWAEPLSCLTTWVWSRPLADGGGR